MQIVLRTVYEAHHVGILLDGTGLTEVAELRTLVFGARFHATVELRQGDDGQVQLFRELFERTRNHAHFLLARPEFHARRVHELKVVYYNHAHTMLTHKTARLGTQLEDGKRGGVVDVQRSSRKVLYARHKLVPFYGRELSALDFGAFDFTHVGD